jgi:hypothetical protein
MPIFSALARRHARITTNPGGAVYGAILVTAAIAGTSIHEDRAWALLFKAASTVLAFWLAHIHSAIVSSHFEEPGEPLLAIAGDMFVHELPMLEIGLAPCLLLVAASLHFFELELAVQLALAIGVAELFAIGFARGRRTAHGHLGSIAIGLVQATVGGALVALKILIH